MVLIGSITTASSAVPLNGKTFVSPRMSEEGFMSKPIREEDDAKEERTGAYARPRAPDEPTIMPNVLEEEDIDWKGWIWRLPWVPASGG